MTKEELLDLYEHRYSVGFRCILESLSDEDKKSFEEIVAQKEVEEWRKDGTLIPKLSYFSKEQKNRYLPFIELNELFDALLQQWVIKRIVLLHTKKMNEGDVQKELSKIKEQQKKDALDFLKKESSKPEKSDYEKEINFFIECLNKEIGD